MLVLLPAAALLHLIAAADDFCSRLRRLYPDWEPPSGRRRLLEIGGFLPSLGWDGGFSLNDSIRPAVDMALDDVAAHPCLLPGHKLRLTFTDTGCSASGGMRSFFELMSGGQRKALALFGGACTAVNEPVAMTAKYWDLLQLSYAETHPQFAAADTFPTFYRMLPADRDATKARIHLLQHFNWTRVGTLKQSDQPKHALPHEAFTTKITRDYGIRVVASADFSSEKPNVTTDIAQLKNKDARILVGDFGPEFARKIFCQAYQQEFYGPSFVWIIPGFHNRAWWLESGASDEESECSTSELLAAMEGHFITESVTSRQWAQAKDPLGINGKTVGAYMTEYTMKCLAHPNCDAKNALHGYAYDGLFTFAVALDAAIRSFPLDNAGESFEEMILERGEGRRWLLDALHSALNLTSFLGVTGEVKFESRARLGKIRIAQFQNGTYATVGEFDGARDAFRLDSGALGSWAAPLDGTRVVYRRERVSSGLLVLMSVLAAGGMALALGFLALNIHFRTHRFIRMSSPNMNNMIIAGCLLCYLSVLLLGLDSRAVGEAGFPALCYSKVWILCSGFTLSFGSMFSKTWRVHSIFTNIKLNKKAIKDYKLFLLVGVLLIVDFVVLGVWAALSPTELRLADLPREGSPGASVIVVPQQELCFSSAALVFQSVMYGYKGLLLLMGCFLAWETRHVNVPALNDSKHIGASVYCVVVMCLLGVSLSFILSERVNESFGLSSIAILTSTTLTLALVFGPKAVELIKNPKGIEVKKYRHGMLSHTEGTHQNDAGGGLLTVVSEEEAGTLSVIQADVVSSRVCLTTKLRELDSLMGEASETRAAPQILKGPESGNLEASVSSVVPEDPALPLSPRSAPPTQLQDVDEETSLLPSPDEAGRLVPPLLSRLRASIRRAASSTKATPPEDPRLRPDTREKGVQKGRPMSRNASNAGLPPPSARLPPAYFSMPELKAAAAADVDEDESESGPSLASTALPASLFSESETSAFRSTRVAPFQPQGDGVSRLRFIDSVISEDGGDVILNHSRTLHSIDETAASGELEEDGSGTRRRKRRSRGARSSHQHLWPWLDPALPVSQV